MDRDTLEWLKLLLTEAQKTHRAFRVPLDKHVKPPRYSDEDVEVGVVSDEHDPGFGWAIDTYNKADTRELYLKTGFAKDDGDKDNHIIGMSGNVHQAVVHMGVVGEDVVSAILENYTDKCWTRIVLKTKDYYGGFNYDWAQPEQLSAILLGLFPKNWRIKEFMWEYRAERILPKVLEMGQKMV